MILSTSRVSAALLAAALLIASPAVADQRDEKLPTLFSKLASSTDLSVANKLASDIWSVWLHHDDAEVARFMTIGISAMNQRNLEVAYNAFDHVVGMAPDFAEGWNKRATVNFMLDRVDASMRDIERTLALEPRHFGALSGMGLIFDTIGNPGAAADAWEKALGVHPHIQGARKRIKDLRRQQRGRPI